MLHGQVLEASQVEYKSFEKLPLKRAPRPQCLGSQRRRPADFKLLQKKVAVGLHILDPPAMTNRMLLEVWIVPLSATPPSLAKAVVLVLQRYAIAATGI